LRHHRAPSTDCWPGSVCPEKTALFAVNNLSNNGNNYIFASAIKNREREKMQSVSEIMQRRQSVRAFSDTQVEESELREILELAGLAPSGGNVQPWTVIALTGAALDELRAQVKQTLESGGGGDGPEFPVYPEGMVEPYRSRRYACGEKLYKALEIPREDKMGRVTQVMKNFEFFSAPVGIFLFMDRSMAEPQCLDMGIYLQSLMLLAEERGLKTCPQVSWTTWPKTIAKALDLDRDQKLMAGIALGYAAEDQPVNSLQQDRADSGEWLSIRGY